MCRVCGSTTASDLLRVTAVATGRETFVCRSVVSWPCWASVRTRDAETIAELEPLSDAEMAALAVNLYRDRRPG
jgi:hypothetical protein